MQTRRSSLLTKNNMCGACASGKRASGAYASGERRVCERRCTSDLGRCRERAFSRAREAAGESRPARAACARAASHDRHLTRADPRGQCVRVCVRAARVQAAHAPPPPQPLRPHPLPPVPTSTCLTLSLSPRHPTQFQVQCRQGMPLRLSEMMHSGGLRRPKLGRSHAWQNSAPRSAT